MLEHTPPPETRTPEDTRLALIAALNGYPDAVQSMTSDELATLTAALQAVLASQQRTDNKTMPDSEIPQPAQAAVSNESLAPVLIVDVPVAVPTETPMLAPEQFETPQQRIDAVVARMRGVMEKVTNEADRAIFETVIRELQAIGPSIHSEIQRIRQKAKKLSLAMPSIEDILTQSDAIKQLLGQTHFRLLYDSNLPIEAENIRESTTEGLLVILKVLGVNTYFFGKGSKELPMYGFNDHPDEPNYRMEESGGAQKAEHLATNIPGIAVEFRRNNFANDDKEGVTKAQVAIVVTYSELLSIVRSALETE